MRGGQEKNINGMCLHKVLAGGVRLVRATEHPQHPRTRENVQGRADCICVWCVGPRITDGIAKNI
jgi:hypothetical protein